MPVLEFYADARDRAYGRPTSRQFTSMAEATAAAADVRSPAEVVRLLTDSGTEVPSVYWPFAERQADDDAVIEHDWDRDGWDVFRPVTVNTDDAQTFTTSVVAGRGRVTGNLANEGNLRRFYLREGTRWPDSDITSLWWGPDRFSTGGTTNRPQMGHVHGAAVGDDGLLRGAVLWFNIFGGPNPEALLANTWEGDLSATLRQGTQSPVFSGGGSLNAVGRTPLVVQASRYTFGGTFIDLRVTPDWMAEGVVPGSVGDLTGMAATGLNGVDYTVQGSASALIRLNASGGALTDATAGGTWTPDYPWRVFPYWVRSQYVPPVLRFKQWAYGKPEPDWGSAYAWSANLVVGGTATGIAQGNGYAGLVAAHAHDGSYMEWGQARFQRAA